MNRIELIGAPAVGKSTVLNEMINQRHQNEWKTPYEKRIELVVEKNNLKARDLKSQLIYYVMKSKLAGKKNHILINLLFNSYEQNAIDQYGNDFHPVLKAKLDELNREQFENAFIDAKLIKFFHKILVEDILILKLLKTSEKLVYDEGIIHNLGVVTDLNKFKDLLNKLSEEVQDDFLPKGVIYCDLLLEDYIERRLHRTKYGKSTSIDRTMDEEELIMECQRSKQRSDQKIQTLKSIGVPVLTLDMNKNLQDNSIRANHFITDL